MRLFLSAVFLVIALIPQERSSSQTMTEIPTSNSSAEVQSLKNEIQALEIAVQASRVKQDGWNSWYLKLGVAAIIFGTGLGIASWVCQKKASAVEFSSRPDADLLTAKNKRLRELADLESKVDVARAQQGAYDASARAEVATAKAAEAKNSVAGLEKSAADAKAAQQLVEIELAKQQARAAIAEKDLANLKTSLEPRRLTVNQKTILTRLLQGEPKGSVSVSCIMGDGESNDFATDISDVLFEAGWNKTRGAGLAAYSGGDPVGLQMTVHSANPSAPFIPRLQHAFAAIGVSLPGVIDLSVREGETSILVGHKPRQDSK